MLKRGKKYMFWLYRYPPRIVRGLAEIFKRMGGNFAAGALSGWGSFWFLMVFSIAHVFWRTISLGFSLLYWL